MAYLKSIHSVEAEINLTGKFRGRQAYVFELMGRRAGFTSTTVMNDIKEFDNAVADIPTLSNSSLDIVSDSLLDTNTAGTGARKVKVVYIDSSNNLVESSDINLNGIIPVIGVLTGVNFVLWMEVTDVGSGEVAAGNIRLRITGGVTEVEQISAGGNKSMSAQAMVPAGYKGYITRWRGTSVSSRQRVRIRALVNSLDRSLSSVWHFQDIIGLPADANEHLDLPCLRFPALCKIKVATISSATANTNTVDISLTLILIKD